MLVKKQQLQSYLGQLTGSKLRKEYDKAVHCHLVYLNLYKEYIMQNAGLDELQAGIKIARRNINNLRCADDTTLMAESKEELKSLLMRMKRESEKANLKLNIKNFDHGILSHHFIANTTWKGGSSDRFPLLGL